MKLYVITRPSGWGSLEDMRGRSRTLAGRSATSEMSDDIRWIRSYVVHEPDGGLGTFCIYQASSPEKIREHAERADIPAAEIFEVADTVLVRPDPAPVAG